MSQTPTPSMVYDILEACAHPGCPLCRVSRRWAERFVAAILYEEVTDPHTRGRLRHSFGFCREHAWQATEVGGTLLGMSIIYRSLLNHLAGELEKPVSTSRGNWWQALGGRRDVDAASGLVPAAECPACIHLRGMEDAALTALTDALPDNASLRASLAQSHSGLCLPHLRQALTLARSDAAIEILREDTRRRLHALVGELDEFIRKYDHRFNKEAWGVEHDSWERAVLWMVGGMRE